MAFRVFAPLILVALPCAAARPQLAIADFSSSAADATLARSLAEQVATELERRDTFTIVTSEGLRLALGLERSRQLLGCAEDSCMAELAGALAAQYLLSGSVTRRDDVLQLSLVCLDGTTSRSVGRATRLARSAAELDEAIPFMVAEAVGLPPPRRSALPAITLLVTGAVVASAAAVFGAVTLSEEGTLLRELELAGPATSYSSYASAAGRLAGQRTLAVVGLIAGTSTALAGAIWLLLPARASLAVVPTGAGASVVLSGALP